MSSTVEAALILLTLFMPGFLAVRGYSVGRPSAPVTDGLPGLGRALTASMFVLLAGWRLGGRDVYGWMQAGTALTTHESQTYAFALGLAVLPPIVGFFAASVVDVLTERVSRIRAAIAVPPDERGVMAGRRRLLRTIVSDRLLRGGHSTWDRTWSSVVRGQRWIYVRVRTKTGDQIVGLVAWRSRIAASPQPRDLYVEQVLRSDDSLPSAYRPAPNGLGAFIAGTEIESIEFATREGFTAECPDDTLSV